MTARRFPASFQHQRAFTLVEVLIAATLGLLVVGAVAGVFIANNRNFRENEALIALQDNARFALETVGRDLTMAGYYGGVRPVDATFNVRRSASLFTAVPAGGQCGPAGAPNTWLFDLGNPIVFANQGVGQTRANFSCITDALAGSDAVAIRRVAGQAAGEFLVGGSLPTLITNRLYLVSNGNIASLYAWPAGGNALGLPADCVGPDGTNGPCPPLEPPTNYHAYVPHIYYVRPGTGTVNRLCRRGLPVQPTTATLTMQEECLADGIDTLQIEWGIDSDPNNNPQNNVTGPPDRYESMPTPAQLRLARTARIHMIVSSTGDAQQLSGDAAANPKRFQGLSDYVDPGPVTNRIRRSFTTTVQLKNFQLE